ncbi:hypothetical protein JW859_04155 [bacterium]|nr:hypothetical protein [bacterium]
MPGCRSASTVADDTPDPYAAFSALPRPSELSARQAAASEAPARSVSNLILMSGPSYTDDPLPSNVERGEDYCALYAETSELTYAFFMLANTVLQDADELTHVSADLSWPGEGDAPQAPYGLYLGLPDYDADVWSWVGPVAEDAGWIDVADRNLSGTVGPEYIVAVAFAPTANIVNLYNLAFRHTSVDSEAGNEWIYYTHEDPAEPTFGGSISRARPDGSEVDHLFVGSETIDNFSPVITTGAERRLAFAHNSGGYDEIWRSQLDGTAPSVLMAIPDTDLVPVGWHPQGASFIFLRREALELYYDLWARDIDAGVNGILHNESEIVKYAVWDTSNDYRFSALAVIGNPDTRLAYVWSEGPLPVESYMDSIVPNALDEYFMDPAPYVIANGLGDTLCGFLCTIRDGNALWLVDFPHRSDADASVDDYLVSAEDNLRSATVSPDGTRVALIRCPAGELSGTLVVTDFVNPDLASAVEIATDVTGDVIWYDPDF